MTRTIEKPKRSENTPSAADRRWQAVCARDPRLDGAFYFSVATTGVYCRPSCPARRPKRENVTFHATRSEAEAAGFRPCKRCKPDRPPLHELNREKVAQACRLIETAEVIPSLKQLADAAGISAYHFHRIFKSVTGVTPKAYATAHRQKRLSERLRSSRTVTEAIFASGFNSSAPFYTNAKEALGMTPSEFRAGAPNIAMRFAVGRCSLGALLVAASDKGVTAIFLGDDPAALVHDLEARFPKATLVGGDRAFDDIMAKVIGLVEEPAVGLDLPLDIRGTAFQHRVWDAIRQIPAGTTATYSDIAERIGMPRAVRAVAAACAANKIAVAIPCHRVVRTDGSLSGYRWRVDRKRKLIAREAKS